MADYWMKLYIEILDDPKMATLPDRLWRRTIELFLVAKKLHLDGHLPDTRQIAWLLRMNADDLEHDMSQIATTGIVTREVNGWFIPNFVKRQAAVPDIERKAQERIRKKSQQYYEDVTDLSRSVTQSTEYRLTEDRVQSTEAETEEEEPAAAFDLLRKTVEAHGIILTGEADIKALVEMVNIGATPKDVEAGIAWKAAHNNGKAIRYAGQLIGPTQTAMAKRLQALPPPAQHESKAVTVVLSDGTELERKS